jgi:simple sugar transport system permease protein
MARNLGSLISVNQRFIPLSATIALFFVAYALGAVAYEPMRDPQVFLNLLVANPFLLISAIGSTFVIVSGGIDLSVSGIVVLTTVASAALLRTGWNPWAVMLVMLLMGMALGAIMGGFITYLKVQPFIATLAGMWFARGMCFFISDDAIPINNRVYRILAQTKILIPGLSDPVAKQGAYLTILAIVAIIVLVAAIYIAHYTRFGRTVYAIGGNEQSARLMGLPVNRTKILVYTLNGFCSALAGITLSMYLASGHGLYVYGFEMTVIAAVVIGGTLLTGGQGYVFGTLFGVLITAVIQTLIQFNGTLSSWWTNIAVGVLTLAFIGVQSLLMARNTRRLASKRLMSQARQVPAPAPRFAAGILQRRKPMLLLSGGALGAIVLVVLVISGAQSPADGLATDTPPPTEIACQSQPMRPEEAASLLQAGAILAYERNGGPDCIDELYVIYPDGRIVGDNGSQTIEKQMTPAELDALLAGISERGWFTEELYNTWHTPCGQCFEYLIGVAYQGQEKTVGAVDGGTDAPADYWQVVSLINGVIPKFTAAP